MYLRRWVVGRWEERSKKYTNRISLEESTLKMSQAPELKVPSPKFPGPLVMSTKDFSQSSHPGNLIFME